MSNHQGIRYGRIDPVTIAIILMFALVVTACGPGTATPTKLPTAVPATVAVQPSPVPPTVTLQPSPVPPTATVQPSPVPSTATLEPTVAPSATEKPTLPPTATVEPTLPPTATAEPTLLPTATIEPTLPLPTNTAEATIALPTDTTASAGPTLSIAMRATVTAQARIEQTNTCLGCHGPYDKIIAASKNFLSENGEKVNPHTTVDDSIIKVHESGEGMLNCSTCHEPHPQPLTSVGDIKPANVEYCYTQCHHQNNFTPCSECHIEYQ